MADLKKEIGQKLKAAFDKTGLSITALAKESGISRETIYAIFDGERDFGIDYLFRLSRTLKISPVSVFPQGNVVDLSQPSFPEIVELLGLFGKLSRLDREGVISSINDLLESYELKQKKGSNNPIA